MCFLVFYSNIKFYQEKVNHRRQQSIPGDKKSIIVGISILTDSFFLVVQPKKMKIKIKIKIKK